VFLRPTFARGIGMGPAGCNKYGRFRGYGAPYMTFGRLPNGVERRRARSVVANK
jgi:hypothetical protein